MAKFQLVVKKSDTFIKDCTWDFEAEFDEIEKNGIIELITNENYPTNDLYVISDKSSRLYSSNDKNKDLTVLTKKNFGIFCIPGIGFIKIYSMLVPKIGFDQNEFIGEIEVLNKHKENSVSLNYIEKLINMHFPAIFNKYKSITVKFADKTTTYELRHDKCYSNGMISRPADTDQEDWQNTEYNYSGKIVFNGYEYPIICDIYNGTGLIMNLCENHFFAVASIYDKISILQKVMYDVEAAFPAVPMKSIASDFFVNGWHMFIGLEKANENLSINEAIPVISYRDTITYTRDNKIHRIPVKYEITPNNINIAYDLYSYGISIAPDLSTNLPITVQETTKKLTDAYMSISGNYKDSKTKTMITASLLV